MSFAVPRASRCQKAADEVFHNTLALAVLGRKSAAKQRVCVSASCWRYHAEKPTGPPLARTSCGGARVKLE